MDEKVTVIRGKSNDKVKEKQGGYKNKKARSDWRNIKKIFRGCYYQKNMQWNP